MEGVANGLPNVGCCGQTRSVHVGVGRHLLQLIDVGPRQHQHLPSQHHASSDVVSVSCGMPLASFEQGSSKSMQPPLRYHCAQIYYGKGF